MRLAAITTFPPSQNPASSFGWQAIGQFADASDVTDIVVLADTVNGVMKIEQYDNIIVDRCWHYNELLTIWRILTAVIRHRPDIVWINLQYTLFGVRPSAGLPCLFIPVLLRILGFPIVVLLHNYLSAVNMRDLGISVSRLLWPLMIAIDRLVLKSILSADCVITMVNGFACHLRQLSPHTDVRNVEQDVYNVPPFNAITTEYHVAALGYFGTYQRLETLIEAFQIIKLELPYVKLKIAGLSHRMTPTYIESIRMRCADQLDGVTFVGYVSDEYLPVFFWEANVIVATHSANPGSSALLRLASAYGRPALVPNVGLFAEAQMDGLGVVRYRPGDSHDLADKLLSLLKEPDRQQYLGHLNHTWASDWRREFVTTHLDTFRALALASMSNQTMKSEYRIGIRGPRL